MKIVHIADVHLCKEYNKLKDTNLINQRKEEIWDAFENLVDYAAENADILIISGDLYEKEKFTFKDFIRIKRIFSKNDRLIKVVSFGNHDYLTKDDFFHELSCLDNFYIFTEDDIDYFEIENLKLRIYGNSWVKTAYSKEIDFSYNLDKNFTNILVAHIDYLKTFPYMFMNLDSILNQNFDYVALGHIHRPIEVGHNIWYSGPLQAQKFSDENYNGFLEIDINNKKSYVKYISIDGRSYITRLVNITDKNIDEIINLMIDFSDNKNFYKIVLEGEANFFISMEFLLDLAKSYFYYLEIEDRVSYNVSLNIDNLLLNMVEENINKCEDKEMVKRAKEKLGKLLKE